MDVVKRFDTKNQWNVITFTENNKEVGIMNIVIEDKEAFIWSMSSYKRGYGTKMIDYLKDSLKVKKIKGDADPDSIGFWNKFEPVWDDESFIIEL